MNPPPLGEALSVGWNTFKQNPTPLIIGTLLANILFLIPFVGIFFGMAGLLYMCLKALRGETTEAKDVFVGFSAALDHIMIGLLQFAGLILCCVGVCVTAPLFYQGYILVFDEKLSWSEAKDRCMAEIKPAWLPWTGFWLGITLVNVLGSLACFVGVLVTTPITMIALAYAYERTLGKGRAKAA